MGASKKAVKVKKDNGGRGWASRMLTPFGDLDREFDSLFRHGWRHPLRGGANLWSDDSGLQGKIPTVDVIDKDDKILIKAQLPGVDKKDLEISVTDETVSIKGQSSTEKEEDKGDYYRREITQGSYERILAIPANVDSSKAKAKFRNGVLEVSLPKTEKTNRINVAVE